MTVTSMKRAGFTLVELLVVIAIIGVLVGLLLPSVQSAREAARKSTCANNVKQMALAAANYESSSLKYPTAGEGKLFAKGDGFNQQEFVSAIGGETVNGTDALNAESFFVQILGFMDQNNIASRWNSKLPYWDSSIVAGGYTNQRLSAAKINGFLCPSNTLTKDQYGGANSAATTNGDDHRYYGQTDYMPVAYVDLETDGTRAKPGSTSRGQYKESICNLLQTQSPNTIGDGTSNTLMFIEDSGRTLQTAGKRIAGTSSTKTVWVSTGGQAAAIDSTWTGWTSDSGETAAISGLVAESGGSAITASPTCPNRWADPDSASGLSGPPNEETLTSNLKSQTIINNNKTVRPGKYSRFGGSTTFDPGYKTVGVGDCSWHLNNCGSNDEPFSTHAGNGVYAGFGDGSVKWISEKLAVDVLRRLCDANDGETVPVY